MAEFKNLHVIDGLSSVRAVERTGPRSDKPVSRPPSNKLKGKAWESDDGKPDKKLASHIGSTVIPKKFDIVCYECGYMFMLTGLIRDTTCPKCHQTLEVIDLTVEGECREKIKTIGTVEIKKEAVLIETQVSARRVVLAGDAGDCSIHAHEHLELCSGSKFDIEKIKTKDLVIGKGCKLNTERKLFCRDLEISGRVSAKIYAEGIVVIKKGGFLSGEIHGPHLKVEEGAGMKAGVAVGIRR